MNGQAVLRLKEALSRQIGDLSTIATEQGLMIADLRSAVADRDATIARLTAELEAAKQGSLPIGDAMPGHEAEANGVAH